MPDITTTDVNKIDAEAVDGLTGVVNSLAYKVHEIEKHLHNWERWIGLAAVPVGETHRFDIDSMTPFQMDAGNDTWGAWLQIVGSTDFPITAGMAYRDAHRILITDIERDIAITRIQIAGGEDADVAVAAGNYTEFMTTPLKNSAQLPITIMTGRALSATKGWIRCWVNGQNTGTVDFFLGVHEYEG
ncbi:MAG: hypothetical protein KAS32_01105 [Candidatus Peribacteraceae bacterium]|nr:hypothetical protein [Candidatus Peribacteraceae bacterium]